MIKRTLYFGNPSFLKTRNEQLIVEFPDPKKEKVTIPIEDIGIIIFDNQQMTFSHGLISKLLENNVSIITCHFKNHLPQGLFLNLDSNSVQHEKFQNQIKASVPLKKQLWKQTIQAKIKNMSKLLRHTGYEASKLDLLESRVRSGDSGNIEAQAGSYYWKNIFKKQIQNFKRDRYGKYPNNFLNYGYAVLRAITARSLTASGLLPTLGIHHHNKYNAYCLADDIMEPFRPFVDYLVLDMVKNNKHEINELTPEHKTNILQLPVVDVLMEGLKSPLMNAMQRTTASLAGCFDGEYKRILYPELI